MTTQNVRPMWLLKRGGNLWDKFVSLTYCHFGGWPHVLNIYLDEKSVSRKNMVLRHWEISVLCIIQECDNIATLKSNFYSIICQVVPYGRLKMKENLKLLDLKVVTVSNGRWFLPRGFKYSDLTWKLLVFWKTGQ